MISEKPSTALSGGLQFVAHRGEKGAFGAARFLGPAQGPAQGALRRILRRHVLDRAFIGDDAPGPVAHRAGVLRNPDDRAVAPADLGIEIGDLVVRLHQGLEFEPPLGIDIELVGDVGQPVLQRRRIGIAVDARQRRIDVEIAPFRRGAENPLDGMLEEGAVAGIAGAQPLVGARRQPVEAEHRRAERRQDHKRRERHIRGRVGRADAQHRAGRQSRQDGAGTAPRARNSTHSPPAPRPHSREDPQHHTSLL